MMRAALALPEALQQRDFMGLTWGMDEADVAGLLGEPEDYTARSPRILRYGDLQLSFDSEQLWLVTVWITEDRLRLRGEDYRTAWRLSEQALGQLLLTQFGNPTVDKFGSTFESARTKVHVVFDDSKVLAKLSLSGNTSAE